MNNVYSALAMLTVAFFSVDINASEAPVDCPDLQIFSNYEQSRALLGNEWILGRIIEIDNKSLE